MASSQRVPMVVQGPLAPYSTGFAAQLRTRGYSPSAVRLRVWQLDGVSRWLAERRLAPGELTVERAEEFLAARRSTCAASGSCPPRRLNRRRARSGS